MEPQQVPPAPAQSPPQSPEQTPQPFEPTPSSQPVMGEVPRTGAMPDEQRGMFVGRLSQRGYITLAVGIAVYFLIIFVLLLTVGGSAESPLYLITILLEVLGIILSIPIGISAGIRRWHDIDQSGWLVLLGFVPFVNFVAAAFLLIVPGTKGPNKYGAEDLRPNTIKKLLLNK